MDTDMAWTKWGATNPYFGVLSEPRYRKEALDDNIDDFFDSGERHVAEMLAKIERTFAPLHRPMKRLRALDFGCGVGRLAIPLARRFRDVVGVDISPPMLAEAERNAARSDQDNLVFVQSDDTLSEVRGRYHLVNSYIVFQHIPPARGMTILGHLLGKVAKGGVASIHICLSRLGGRLAEAKTMVHYHVPGVKRLVNLVRKRPLEEPVMEMNAYDFGAVAQVIADAGFGPLMVETERHGRFLTATIIAVRQDIPAEMRKPLSA